jgi:hypothetical protein
VGRERNDADPLPDEQPRRRHVTVAEEDRERDADDVHTAVHALLKLLPGFTASYVRWLAEYGVDLS